jgi:hypothetical protein
MDWNDVERNWKQAKGPSRPMSDARSVPFNCPNCGVKYEIVRVDALPGPTTNREIVCLAAVARSMDARANSSSNA